MDSAVKIPNYAKPCGKDHWGEKSIALLGDSISFGVGASDAIPENSYVGFVKKAVQAANDGKMNYGFTSAYPTSWQPHNRADEIHKWPERSESDGEYDWACDGDEDGRRLISVGMTAKKPWATLTYALRAEYADAYTYFCVYYHTKPHGGSFAIADGNGGEVADIHGSNAYISADNTVEETKRTAFYRLADCPDGKIVICAGADVSETSPITVTGIGYYKDPSYVTFNSYTRGGISLVNMSDMVLSQVAASDTLITALGFNDAAFHYTRVKNGEFKDRIDYLIKAVRSNGTQLIVHDYCWDNPPYFTNNGYDASTIALIEETRLYVKSELRRLATETNGIYIDQAALLGEAINDDLNSDAADGIHPTSAGHKMIAKNVVAALGLTWTEVWT